MKQQELRKLVDSYYNGTLSEEDELVLKQYIYANDISEYESIKEQFQIMDALYDDIPVLDEEFDNNMLDKLMPHRSKRIPLYLSGIAAAIIVLFTVWFNIDNITPTPKYGTVNNPESAYSQTRIMLNEVSKNLNKGIAPVTRTINKADDQIEKTKNIQSIKKLNETNRFLFNFVKVDVYLGNL